MFLTDHAVFQAAAAAAAAAAAEATYTPSAAGSDKMSQNLTWNSGDDRLRWIDGSGESGEGAVQLACSCSSFRVLAPLAVFLVSARVLKSLTRLTGGSSVSRWQESGEELSCPYDSAGGAGALYFFRDLPPTDD